MYKWVTIGKWLSLGLRTVSSDSISTNTVQELCPLAVALSVCTQTPAAAAAASAMTVQSCCHTEQVRESVSAKDLHEPGEPREKTSLSNVDRHPNRNRDGGKAKSSLSLNLVCVLRQLCTR